MKTHNSCQQKISRNSVVSSRSEIETCKALQINPTKYTQINEHRNWSQPILCTDPIKSLQTASLRALNPPQTEHIWKVVNQFLYHLKHIKQSVATTVLHTDWKWSLVYKLQSICFGNRNCTHAQPSPCPPKVKGGIDGYLHFSWLSTTCVG